jgi:exodeoxyribonuclease VII small subunit
MRSQPPTDLISLEHSAMPQDPFALNPLAADGAGSTAPSGDQPLAATYEEAFRRLEEVIEALESGDLPLEQSLLLYEQGASLAAYCTRILDEAELRVRQWQPGDQTTPVEEW